MVLEITTPTKIKEFFLQIYTKNPRISTEELEMYVNRILNKTLKFQKDGMGVYLEGRFTNITDDEINDIYRILYKSRIVSDKSIILHLNQILAECKTSVRGHHMKALVFTMHGGVKIETTKTTKRCRATHFSLH